jgi:hypothetical protein
MPKNEIIDQKTASSGRQIATPFPRRQRGDDPHRPGTDTLDGSDRTRRLSSGRTAADLAVAWNFGIYQ